MKALVKYDFGPINTELRDVPIPEAGPGEVRIRVMKAGICGSDMHLYHADSKLALDPPVVMGHEYAGIIDQVGEGVTKFKVGQKASSEIGVGVDENCAYCQDGNTNMCIHRRSIGYVIDGCFAEYIVVPEKYVVAIPDGVSWTSAAMMEPLACICHCCYDVAHIHAGDVVLITGAGPMGQMMAQVVKAFGATVIITDITSGIERLKLAKQLGADYAVNTEEEDVKELIMRLTNGYGADSTIDCSGTAAGINTCLDCVKKCGEFTEFAICKNVVDVHMDNIIYREVRMQGAMSSIPRNWRQAARLLEHGLVNLEPLATEFALDDWQAAVDYYDSREGYKIIFAIGTEE